LFWPTAFIIQTILNDKNGINDDKEDSKANAEIDENEEEESDDEE